MSDFKWKEMYMGYLNLDSRPDRREKMESELSRVGLSAIRTRGKLPDEFNLNDPKLQVMVNRTKGACGCHYGQVEIMQEALKQNKHCLVMEDDLVIATDVKERFDYIESFLNKQDDWWIFWMGGTYHIPPYWHKEGHSPDLQICDCTLGRDAQLTTDERIIQTFGAFSTHGYILNVKHIQEVLEFLESHVHLSMGVDWIMILLQPKIKSFAFLPGIMKQYNNQSNIGDGITYFENFSKLNGSIENSAYWWQDKMEDFDPNTFDWKDAHQR